MQPDSHSTGPSAIMKQPHLTEARGMAMTHTWLEANGRRLPMKRLSSGMSVQFALYGADYTVGIFLISQQLSSESHIKGIDLSIDGSCRLLWATGAVTHLGTLAAPLVAGCQRCGEALLTWRDDNDRMIQREFFSVKIVE